jgi:hypothetical protein
MRPSYKELTPQGGSHELELPSESYSRVVRALHKLAMDGDAKSAREVIEQEGVNQELAELLLLDDTISSERGHPYRAAV